MIDPFFKPRPVPVAAPREPERVAVSPEFLEDLAAIVRRRLKSLAAA